jgi:two-component system, OmpR family, response regulator AdeR
MAGVSTPSPMVLVVEDEPAIAHLVRGYLEREGLRVRVVTDGPER